MQRQSRQQRSRGLLTATAAYMMWGILPLYWKALGEIPAYEIICHRILWSFLFTLLLIAHRDHCAALPTIRGGYRSWVTFLGTALLLAVNWLIYIWAVNSGYIVESSLGYFINPLIAVFFGVVFLKESLRPGQWPALSLALAGVLYLTFFYGRFPWISLSLAVTFALYSLLRKTAKLHSLDGLAFETGILSIPAMAAVLFFAHHGESHFFSTGPLNFLLLVLSGPVTALPLLLFVYGAQRITMTAVGLLQYLAPTLQFLIGRLVFNEPFPRQQLIGFTLIWAALALYTAEGLLIRLRRRHRLNSR